MLVFLVPWASALADGTEGYARIAQVIDGDTVTLTEPFEGAREVRLVGIQAPKLPLGRAGFAPWPLADEARDALSALIMGRQVHLVMPGRRTDRHGRLLAHVYRADDGVWVQGRMLELGLARVYSFADNRHLVEAMLALEGRARAAKRGLWAEDFYAIRSPDTLRSLIGTFQLVEGDVVAASQHGRWSYLNFGDDWRTDFTVSIAAPDLVRFREVGVDPQALVGQRVRVRGWLDEYNGPAIRATHPEQIELVDQPAHPTAAGE